MRITEKFLEKQVQRLNKIVLNNINPKWSEIGSFDLDYAYGGVKLIRYINENGLCEDVFSSGHTTKKELSNLINAFAIGLTFKK